MSEQPSSPPRSEWRLVARTVGALLVAPLGVALAFLGWTSGDGLYLAAAALTVGLGLSTWLLIAKPVEHARPRVATALLPAVALGVLPFVASVVGALGGWLGSLVPIERVAAPIASAAQTAVAPLAAPVVAGVALACGGAVALIAAYLARTRPDHRAVAAARALRAATWTLLVVAVFDALTLAGVESGRSWAAFALRALAVVLAGELVARTIAAFVVAWRGERRRSASDVVDELLTLRVLAGRMNPLSSLFDLLAEVLGVDLWSAWAIRFVRGALPTLALGLAAAAWLLTCVTMIDAHERGMLERFGRRVSDAPLEPGAHVTLPWPIDRVRRVSVDRVQSMTLGFRGQKEGASMLWTVRHAAEEHQLLLGDGRDLVTVNAILNWRVRDPLIFLYRWSDAAALLEAVADRVIMTRIIGRSLDEVLSENLETLAETLETDVAAEADRLGLGIEVVDLTVLALHPPVAVAPDYQAVVGAEIERETLVLEAEAYRAETIPEARADSLVARSEAGAHRASRLALAKGEAEAFRALVESYAFAPALFRFRMELERLEAALADRHVHVVDHRIEKDGGSWWILE